MYRYTNDLGNMVVDYQVPPGDVDKGYEVLNAKGIVIKVVPRTLTGEERKVADAQQRLEEAALAEEQRLREWDESLLLRYSTVADVEAARDRALMDLRIRVSILKSNKRSLKQHVENNQAQAAELERLGHEVGVELLSSIEDLQLEIEASERAIATRQKEIKAVEAAYQADIERFSVLQEMLEFRRNMVAKQRQLEEQEKHHDPRR